MNIAIVEDDPRDSGRLMACLKRYEEARGQNFTVDLFPGALPFLGKYDAKYDIILMDIEMPGMNGMEAAQKLRRLDDAVCLIFITNMAQYAIKGYEVNAMDFLLKPVEYFSFSSKLDKAIRSCRLKRGRTFCFQTSDGPVRVDSSAIRYVESEKHNIYVVTADGRYRIRSSMKEMERLLPGELFVRCDNSYIVGLAYVDRVDRDSARVGPYTIPVSRLRRKDLVDAFTRYLGEIP